MYNIKKSVKGEMGMIYALINKDTLVHICTSKKVLMFP